MVTRRRQVSVDIVGNADRLEREFRRAERDLDATRRRLEEHGIVAERASERNRGFASSLGDIRARALAMTAAVTAGVAAMAGAVEISRRLANASSDLNEAQERVRQVFGDSASTVLTFGENAAASIGQANREALEGAAGFGAMFNTVGLADERAAEMSVTLTQLASDMASFNNEDPSAMLERLRSGLAGEAEPLRRFGVFLSAARVEQEALRMGLAETTGEIDEQDKILARFNIIMQDTVRQQGDFERTIGGLANQSRILTANLQDMAATAGRELEPAFAELTAELNGLINTHGDEFATALGTGFGLLADGVNEALDVTGDLLSDLDAIASLGVITVDVVVNVTRRGGDIVEEFTGQEIGGGVTRGDVLRQGGRVAETVVENAFAGLRSTVPGLNQVTGLFGLASDVADRLVPEEAVPGIGPAGRQLTTDDVLPSQTIGPFAQPGEIVAGAGLDPAAARELAAIEQERREANFAAAQEERRRREQGGRGGGGLSEAQRQAQEEQRALQAIEDRLTSRLVDAFLEGGDARVAVVREENERLLAEFEEMMPRLRELGLEIPETAFDAFVRAREETERAFESGGTIGGLLGFLLTRRLAEGLAPGGGLIETPGAGGRTVTIGTINIESRPDMPGGVDVEAVARGVDVGISRGSFAGA